MVETKSLCGALTLLATIFDKDVDRLKLAYGIHKAYTPCIECGKPLVSQQRKYCSRECWHNHIMVKVACDQCGVIFERYQSYIISRMNRPQSASGKPQERWFCSRACLSSWMSENPALWYAPHRKYDHEQIIQLAKDGLSNMEIIAKLGMPVASGGNTCSKLRRVFNLPSGIRRKWNYDEIRHLRAQGFKLREITERTGASPGILSNALYKKVKN